MAIMKPVKKQLDLENWQNIQDNFDKVDEDFSSINERVVNLINNPDGTKDLEIVDARHSTAKGKIFETLDARLEEAEQDHKTHWAENVTDTDGAHGLKMSEGTFTPYFYGNTVPGSNTYNLQYGAYKKFNKTVFFSLTLWITTVDSQMAGAVKVGGLPFAAADNFRGVLSIGLINNITYNTGEIQMTARLDAYKNNIDLFMVKSGATQVDLLSTAIKTGAWIGISGTYFVN